MDDVVTLRVSYKYSTTISRGDESKITGKLAMFFFYPWAGLPDSPASIHSLIMGPRPDDVPEDWVIDHIDRNKLNNTRENLRWVSPSFNVWNCVRKNEHGYTSRFRGVRRMQNQWRAYTMGAHVGHFDTEREAAIASAMVCIRKFGAWAESSDLLFTADQTAPGALLSLEELTDIKLSIAAADALPPAPVNIMKGSGIQKTSSGKFKAVFRNKHVGTFETFADAATHRAEHVAAVNKSEWQAHKMLPITRDNDGVAVIALTDSKYGTGVTSKVDSSFWHILTFRQKWHLTRQGYAKYTPVGMLHKAVWLLIDPDYKPGPNKSIDHTDPTAKLDNRRSNLRIASDREQMQNKAPRLGGSSVHVGVCAVGNLWQGNFSYTTDAGTQKFQTPHQQTEREVVLLLNAKRLEVHGDRAILDRTFM